MRAIDKKEQQAVSGGMDQLGLVSGAALAQLLVGLLGSLVSIIPGGH